MVENEPSHHEYEGFIDCALCPRECHVDRVSGEAGVCGADAQMRVSRAALHFWEEPPISGSSGSGTIFFSNCSLGCIYCQNYAISAGGAGTPVGISDVAEMCLDLQSQGALNVNLVTPTHFSPLIRVSIGIAQERGMELPVIWNTSGYEKADEVKKNADTVDVYLTDFKYFDDNLSKQMSGVGDYRLRATEAIDAMADVAGPLRYEDFDGGERLVGGVVIRHMLIPGHLDDSKKVIQLIHDRYGESVLVSIMNQYTPVLRSRASSDPVSSRHLERFPELGRNVSTEEYESLLDHADRIGVRDYFWQDGETCQESFIPDFE